MGAYPEFARLLNHYLTSQDRSLNWLAGKLGCNASTVHRWAVLETRPRDPTMITTILELFDIDEPQERQALFNAAGHLGPSEAIKLTHNQKLQEANGPTSSLHDFIAYDNNWVGRDMLVKKFSDQIQANCRLLLLTGMAGIGKTALAERLTLELTPWLSPANSVVRLNFDFQDRRTDFAAVALKWLAEWGKIVVLEEQQSPDFLLNSLMQALSDQRHLIIIDALEKIIVATESDGQNGLDDEWWVRFFHALLSAEKMSSRVIVTTQDLPEQIVRFGGQYHNRLSQEMIFGLSQSEQDALFQKAGLLNKIDQEEKQYLERISRAYAGHPLALRAIIGEITSEFDGDVLIYWHTYCREFECVEQDMAAASQGGQIETVDNWRLDRFSVELNRQVRHRLDCTFERLSQQASDAYLLICTAAVYRCPVKERFWLGQLAERSKSNQQQQAALRTLYERSLVERSRDSHGNLLIGLHNLIRSIALDHHSRLFTENDFESEL